MIARLIAQKVQEAIVEYRTSIANQPPGHHVSNSMPMPMPGYGTLPQPTPPQFYSGHLPPPPQHPVYGYGIAPPPAQMPTPPQAVPHQAPTHGPPLPPIASQAQPPPAQIPPSPEYQPKPAPPGTEVPSPAEILASLGKDSLRALLADIGSKDTTGLAYTCLVNAYLDQQSKEQSRVIDFDSYGKDAWHAINTRYSRLSSSKQYEVSWEVTSEVVSCIKSIGKQVQKASSYGTKLSALETLRKIAKTILLSGGTLGHEVRKQFPSEYIIIETMGNILDGMPHSDCVKAGRNVSDAGKGTLLEKVAWVYAEAESLVIDGLNMGEVYDMLCGEASIDQGTECEQQREQERSEVVDVDGFQRGGREAGPDHTEANAQATEPAVAIGMPPFDFERSGLRVDLIITQRDESVSGSHKYGKRKGLEAVSEIEAELSLVKQQVALSEFLHSPLAYKMQALEALCTIGVLVITTEGDIVAREIRRAFQHANDIPNLMSIILKTLSPKDLEQLRKSSLFSDLERLVGYAHAYGIDIYDILEDLICMPETNASETVVEQTSNDVTKEPSDARGNAFQDAMQRLFSESVFANGAADLKPLVSAINDILTPGTVPFTEEEALRSLHELNDRDVIMLSGDIVYRLDGTKK